MILPATLGVRVRGVFVLTLAAVALAAAPATARPLPDDGSGATTGPQPMLQAADADTEWLPYVNFLRGLAGLPSLTENVTWSDGDGKHALYMVKNNVIGHSEDPGLPYFTAEGNLAAQNSNVMVTSNVSATDRAAIDMWITGPFHAVGILDPRLAVTGFGSYREADGGWQMAAALDVIRGLGSMPASVAFPVAWPGPDTAPPLGAFAGSESPDPLTSCSGYTAPTGLPIILQFAQASPMPLVTGHWVYKDGAAVEHCAFDETSYVNPDATSQSTGRQVLAARRALVLIPRAPLTVGSTYNVTVQAGSVVKSWSFTGGCPLALSPTSVTFASAAASGSVGVTTSGGCSWTATTSDSWIHVTSGGGTTHGTVQYSVDGNAGAQRQGTISVGGQAFTITQGTGAGQTPPGAFAKSAPASGSPNQPRNGTLLAWQASVGATGYEYCVDEVAGTSCDGNWVSIGNATTVFVGGFQATTPYYWQVRATNAGGTTEADGGTWWSFVTKAGGLPADIDGDRVADLTVWRGPSGTWFTLMSAAGYGSGSYASRQWGSQAAGDVTVPADYDGDGRTDLAVWRPSTGIWYTLNSSDGGATWLALKWGAQSAGDIPVPADYDGDGKADPAVWRPSTGTWYVLKSGSNYSAFLSVGWGASGDTPLPADFDGDGKADLAVWRGATGTWYVLQSSAGYATASYRWWQWGGTGDLPVPADYDGDRRADLAVWRPSTGTWFVLKSTASYSAGSLVLQQWGSQAAGDALVPADYDGDGKTDFAVWRPSTGMWYALKSGTGNATYFSQQWGSGPAGDVPTR